MQQIDRLVNCQVSEDAKFRTDVETRPDEVSVDAASWTSMVRPPAMGQWGTEWGH